MNSKQYTAARTLLALLLTLSIARELRAENSIKFLDKELIKQLNHGIYEVVTPKLENSKIEYDRKLPFEKLDFKERNEKYNSIGTAFFINEKELMTAGHVFSPMYFSLQKNYFIRDSEGKVYPVANVHQYSTMRDMLVFDLEQYPAQVRPLKLSGQLEVGDTVFSAGNALGEGIAYRAGQVAAFTDEREYGKWKDIRFSSPASPGNSGGPLLNVSGEVAGVIVQRANAGENYNIAVPVSEIDHLSSQQAEFQLRNLTVGIDGTDESILRDWSFTLPLPAPVAEFAEKSQNALDAFYKKLALELTDKVKEKNFPRGERFRYYLRNQPVFQGFASVVPDNSFNTWSAVGYDLEKLPLSAEQNVFRGGSLHFDLHVLVEKPPKTALKTFLDTPKMVTDNLLKAIPYYRSFGADKIRITSFGEPTEKTAWQDKLGRKWTSSLWYGDHGNYFIYSHCLPHPKGVLCNISAKPVNILKMGYLDTVKDGCNEIAVGYEGEIDDWSEYLALGEQYVPTLLQQAAITRDGSTLKVKLKDFKFTFSNPKINGKSSLHLHLGYANDQLLAEDLVRFELFPQKGSTAQYSIRPLFAANSFSQESYAASWEEAAKGTGEFSGKVIDKGDRRIIQRIAPQTKKTLTAFDGQKIEKIFAVGCSYKTAAEEEGNIEQDCARFFQSVEFF